MKNWKAILLAAGFIGLLAWQTHENKQQEKKYTVTLTFNEWVQIVEQYRYVGERLRYSDLPSREVTMITDSIILPAIAKFSEQVNQQRQTESPQNGKTDSSGVKKNVPKK